MITSLSSPKIVRVRRLLESLPSKDRKEIGHFVVEGLRAIEGVVAARGDADLEIYATSEWIERFPEANVISEEVAKKISDTITTQGIFAVVPIAPGVPDLSQMGSIALFFELQDPGNAGTVMRSAHAFGIDAIVLGKGSVDPYSGKVVRASAGSISAMPILFGVEINEFIESLGSTHQILAFDMRGEDISRVAMKKPVLVIFGNEARGLPSQIVESRSIEKVRIPMADGIESLNVASAATIAMYEISRRD